MKKNMGGFNIAMPKNKSTRMLKRRMINMRRMTSNEIRTTYLKYFEERGHQIMPSASLIPNNDPTVLWVNAGITPLKKYFDGSLIPQNKRMTSCQKCIRTNDIENVGKTARHHTFFEMLGNFSIGDYFKKEAIEYSIELLTSEKYFGFDKNKLYVTIYPSDREALDLWLSVGIKEDHIISVEDNFWEIGEGPCGPDSEIFYDRGEEFDPHKKGIELLKKDIENDRYIEIWNNVFSQFNSKSGLTRDQYPELPNKNIDTGMGLERMACIIQEGKTNYETDLFIPIIEEIEKLSKEKYHGEMAFKVIADHTRTLVYAFSDGAFFSNEGRGYVLRRLLRRAVRYGKSLGIEKSFIYLLVDTVVNLGKDYYPDLLNNASKIKKLILKEEELFHKTLISGEERLEELMKNNPSKVVSGGDVFRLYDTFGFPFELSLETLQENGFSVSKEEFDKCMQNQKDMARSSRKSIESMNIQNEELLNFKNESTFIGYDEIECETKVIGLIKDNKFVSELNDEGYIILEKTPFYAELGGQVADHGLIYNESTQINVLDVIKAPHKQHLHLVKVISGEIKLNDTVTAKIDLDRRNAIAKNHSATHLLQEALQETLGKSLSQAGSRVDNKTLRFDFNYPNKIKDEDLILTEMLVNEKINTKENSKTEIMPLAKAKELGAMALFEEKYDDNVRVVTLLDSIELCGGTHVKNLGDIKLFAIKYAESKGSNVYRIEATTDNNIATELYEEIKPYNEEMEKLLNKAKKIIVEAAENNIKLNFDVNINNDRPISYKNIYQNRKEVENVRNQVKLLEKEYNNQKENKSINDLTLFDYLIKKNSIGEYIITKVNDYDSLSLKTTVDQLTKKLNNGFVFIANVCNDNVNFIAKCYPEMSNKINCGELVKEASINSGGNGGGSNIFGQGGGTDITKLDEILEKISKKAQEV
ncbi:MAG: alanine--tRNA ligase [Bacilli bacterium]|nr:alanine--tRNA ligase [Bacilli bacterium]